MPQLRKPLIRLMSGLLCASVQLPVLSGQTDSATKPPKESVALIDRFEKRVASTVDGSARWVDDFFGDNRYAPSQKGAFGRLSFLPYFYEYNGLDSETRFRAYLPLDRLNHRLHAMIGRGDEDDLINADHGFEEFLPNALSEDEWLVGLGYRPPWGGKNRFSLSGGIKVDWPPDPYVRLSYRFLHEFDENSLIRFTPSVYWQNTENIGSRTLLDLERRITDQNLLRWSNYFKISGKTEELRYDTKIALYRDLLRDRGIVYVIGMRGDTGERVPVRDYGVYAVYRQKMWRDWFYGQILGGVALYKEDQWTNREVALIFGVGFEMFFSADKSYTESQLDLTRLRSDW